MSIQQFGKKFPILLRTPSPRGQVELLETIGKGNYGYVYKQRNHGGMKVVQLKEDELKETLLEMEIIKACNHLNVTSYMGCFLKGLDLWICMEFCGGGALDSLYRAIKKTFSEDQIAAIIHDCPCGKDLTTSTLKVALIHRELKLETCFLTEDGEIKLILDGPEVIRCDPDSASSRDASYDYKADIWSIGITAIEIADKNPPLSDIHPMRALYLIPDSDLNLAKPKAWSKPFVDFIANCLVKDPVKRPSAAKLLEHPFMQKARGLNRKGIIADLIVKAKIARDRKKAGYD
ncbi:kinase-like domain-containing protein, partial [Zopfochytrium polystomum]